MRQRLITLVAMLTAIVAGAWADGDYQYDPGLYSAEFEMCVSLTDATGGIKSQADLGGGTYTLYAFIGNECRGSATMEDTGGNLFQLRVWGNPSDNAKEITFRLVVEENMAAVGKAEYRFPSKNDVYFIEHGRKGYASAPYKIVFVPAVSISLPADPITVHFGDSFDMSTVITTEPADALVPYPHQWYGDEYKIQIGDDILDAIGVTPSIPVALHAGTGMFQLEAMGQVIVDNPAVSFEWFDPSVIKNPNDGSKGELTLAYGNDNLLLGLLWGQGYSLTGKDPTNVATTTYTWTSSNTSVINIEPTGGFSFLSAGTTVLTGVPDDGTTYTNPQLTVTVEKVISDFTFGPTHRSDTILVLQEGDNLTQRIKNIMYVEPLDVTNPDSWDLQVDDDVFLQRQGNDLIAVNATTNIDQLMPDADGYYRVNSFDQGVKVTISALDFGGYTKDIYVVIIPQQPNGFEFVANPLSVMEPSVFPGEITNDVYKNVKLTRNNVEMTDSTLFDRIQWTSQDEATIIIDPSGPRQTIWLQLDNDGVITASLMALNNEDTRMEPGTTFVLVKGVPLGGDLNITIVQTLSGFKVASVTGKVGETVEITLVPQPDGLAPNMVEPDKISVSVTPVCAMPQNWSEFAKVAVKPGDNTRLNWDVTPSSVGNAEIVVEYDGVQQPVVGGGQLFVAQNLALTSGWQWISLFQGQMYGKESMLECFGSDLEEIRSSYAVVYNDPVYGYFGALNELDTLQTYKLKMKQQKEIMVPDRYQNATSYFLNNAVDPNGPAAAGPLSITVRNGWNWIGNPYQYPHKLSEIFGNTQFTDEDIIKGKTGFDVYTGGAWKDDMVLQPGQGYMFYMANGGQVDFTREFSLSQTSGAPSNVRAANTSSALPIDHSRFIDNMAMIAHVGGVDDASHLTLYAFRNGECRGRGVAVGDRQFITIHGEKGERFTFAAYDELTGQYYEVIGSRAFATVSGSFKAPVPLYVGEATTVGAILNKTAADDAVYDLQGRRVGNAQAKKGIYVQQGRKVVKN